MNTNLSLYLLIKCRPKKKKLPTIRDPPDGAKVINYCFGLSSKTVNRPDFQRISQDRFTLKKCKYANSQMSKSQYILFCL